MPTLLLVINSREDEAHQSRFSKLKALSGWNVKVCPDTRVDTMSGLQLICHGLKIDSVVCSSQKVLQLILEGQYDYNRSDSRVQITLDDYAGSVLNLYPVGTSIFGRELVVVNPLQHLLTTPTGEFLFNRYISKLTRKDSWYPQTNFQYEVLDVTNKERCEELVNICRESDLIADDIETAIGDEQRRITVVGFCAYSKRTHSTLSIVIPFNSSEAWGYAKKIAELPVRKVFQNGLYDCLYKARWNCLPSHWFWDTQSLFHCWYSELPKRLDFVTSFSIRRIRFWKDDSSSGSLDDYYRYNARDTWATVNACLSLVHEMPDWAVTNYLQEFPLHFPAFQCNMEGLAMDMPLLLKVQAEKEAKSVEELARIKYVVNAPGFNPGSWQQVLALIYGLGIKGVKRTGKAEMLKIKATSVFNDIVFTMITDYKENRKLLDTYFVEGKFWNDRLYYSLSSYRHW